MPAPTLIDYYKKFKSLYGALAGIFTLAGPLASIIFSGAIEAYAFPPLGNTATIGRLGILVLGGALTFIAFWDTPRVNPFKKFLIIGGCAFLSLVCYMVAFAHFVKRVDIPASESSVFVTVGYEKTEFAIKNFPSETDSEMLTYRSTDDEQIEKLWTPRSVDIARTLLFFSYSGFILPFVLIFSLGVRYEL
ncbi:MAG TPA: hypothetical protein VGF44_09030 [Terriglobales bacterium]